MQGYGVGGFCAIPSAVNEPLAVLWNPSSSKSIFVTYAFLSSGNAVSATMLRVSTRGTPGSTVTPDADNAFSRQAAPPSAVELNLSDFTATPTTDGPEIARTRSGNTTLNMAEWAFGGMGLEVPAGSGLALHHAAGTLAVAYVGFTWKE